MLSLSESFLFVWEPADLLMPWHVFHLPKWSGGGGRKILVKKPCGGSENFDHKEGLYYGVG